MKTAVISKAELTLSYLFPTIANAEQLSFSLISICFFKWKTISQPIFQKYLNLPISHTLLISVMLKILTRSTFSSLLPQLRMLLLFPLSHTKLHLCVSSLMITHLCHLSNHSVKFVHLVLYLFLVQVSIVTNLTSLHLITL